MCILARLFVEVCKQEESSASQACSIAVPVLELEKLEQAREQLYKFLSDKLDEQQMLGLANITGQMWRVANTKYWGRQYNSELPSRRQGD